MLLNLLAPFYRSSILCTPAPYPNECKHPPPTRGLCRVRTETLL